MKTITYTIPKDLVSSAGNHLGIMVNSLAGYFGFGESNGSIRPEEGWEGILPLLLQPRNFTGMTALFEDDSLLFSNIITGKEDAAFCGEEDGNLQVMPLSQVETIQLLASYLGETDQRPKIKQELSGDALICMLSIADTIRRAKLENILNPSKNQFEITEEILRNEFLYNFEGKNIRWLSAFLADLRWEEKPVDFKKALKELTKMGLINYNDSKIEFSENGELFFNEFIRRKTILGLRSVFYHEGRINYLAMGLMRTENYLWFLDTTDKACLMSISYEEAKDLIGTIISPGDEPPVKAKEEAKGSPEPVQEPKVKAKSSTPKFCRNCGEKLTIGANFCKKCGTKV